MMQDRPIRASRRMWTASHTRVPSPSTTPFSTSAVGWTQAGGSSTTSDLLPQIARQRRVGRLDHLDRGERVVAADQRLALAAQHRAEVLGLLAQGADLVPRLAERHPVGVAVELAAGPLPADHRGPGGA